jgi:hypothetical protein
MMITKLKDLEQFFKLCRKQGILRANLTSMTFEFGELPEKKSQTIPSPDEFGTSFQMDNPFLIESNRELKEPVTSDEALLALDEVLTS